MPVLAEAQPRPLRVSQLNADPKRYDEQEIVLRAYFKTDIAHYAVFIESRAIDDEMHKVHRALQGELENGRRVDWNKLNDYTKKYCLRVLNRTALLDKFGRGYTVNEHTVSVRGIYIADAGEHVFGFGGCDDYNAGFLITEVLRKED